MTTQAINTMVATARTNYAKSILTAITDAAMILLCTAAWLTENTTQAERAAMGVKLPGDR